MSPQSLYLESESDDSSVDSWSHPIFTQTQTAIASRTWDSINQWAENMEQNDKPTALH